MALRNSCFEWDSTEICRETTVQLRVKDISDSGQRHYLFKLHFNIESFSFFASNNSPVFESKRQENVQCFDCISLSSKSQRLFVRV